jgi:uncharacterized protein
MKAEYARILDKSKATHDEIVKKMRHLARFDTSGFDRDVWGFHDEVFAKIDCLECGNCCKAMSPRFRETDVKLLCKATGDNPTAFKKRYLKQDEEGVGYVLQELPCPLQNEDGSCSEYELRTLSCKEFPHTKDRNIQKHLVGLAYDSLVCPAAYLIIERIIEKHG